jgi:guanyl-specific ribonuclease Sa
MLRRFLALLCVGLALSASARENPREVGIAEASLPPEARVTLRLIDRGGPFPYPRDGIVFQNREQRLPLKQRGYYREYTVPTPGRRDRGARRIVSGDMPPAQYYYTDDHYRSFRKILRQE